MRHKKTRKLFRKNRKNRTIKAYDGGTLTISDSTLSQALNKNSSWSLVRPISL